MRILGCLAVALALTACDKVNISFGDKDRKAEWARIDESILTTSSGEVQLSDGRRLPYSVSSEQYRRWDVAQGSLDRGTAERFGELLDSQNPSEASMQRAVDYLESNRDAREAIERTGMSVRDFVMTTVALEQEMRLATGQGRPPNQVPMPPLYSPVDTYALDTFPTYQPMPLPPPTPVPTYTPYTPTFDPRDTMTRVLPPARVDTLYPTPATAVPTEPRPATPPPVVVPSPTPTPRDTVRPRTDTQPTSAPVYPAPLPPRQDTSTSPSPSPRPRPDSAAAQPDSTRRW